MSNVLINFGAEGYVLQPHTYTGASPGSLLLAAQMVKGLHGTGREKSRKQKAESRCLIEEVLCSLSR
eukprot:c21495_g1_i1 orf=96-296(-)